MQNKKKSKNDEQKHITYANKCFHVKLLKVFFYKASSEHWTVGKLQLKNSADIAWQLLYC